jgi:hypothetical protein
VNGKNPKVKKCPKTDHHIAARVLDFSFFLLNKQTNEQKAPVDEMERTSRNPNILQQTNGFLSSTILGNPKARCIPFPSILLILSSICKKDTKNKLVQIIHFHQFKHLLSNKINFFCLQDLLSLSLSLPFYLLPIIPSNWKTVRPLTGSPEPLHIRERVSQKQNFQDKASKTEKNTRVCTRTTHTHTKHKKIKIKIKERNKRKLKDACN